MTRFAPLRWPLGKRRTREKVDGRRVGSLTEFLLKTIAEKPGVHRVPLRDSALASERFGPKVRANPNGFYNQISRHIGREEVVLIEGGLFLQSMAPAAPAVPQNVTAFPVFSS